METPNAQNWLVELDGKSMCPTGRIVVRDLTDTFPMAAVFEARGDPGLLERLRSANNSTTAEDDYGGEVFSDSARARPLHLRRCSSPMALTPWEANEKWIKASCTAYFKEAARLWRLLPGERARRAASASDALPRLLSEDWSAHLERVQFHSARQSYGSMDAPE